MDEVVRAAGGLVLRGAEVLVVHRPKRDDWSFPKGKLEGGESFEEAALREVEEETGYVCELGSRAGEVRYRDQKGRPKTIRYWLMRPVSGEGRFAPGPEVDEIRWVPLDQARQLLSYATDRGLLAQLLEAGRIPPDQDRNEG